MMFRLKKEKICLILNILLSSLALVMNKCLKEFLNSSKRVKNTNIARLNIFHLFNKSCYIKS